MTRTELHTRLIELGTAIATGGVSDAYAGSKLWENLIEGTGGGVSTTGKVPNFLPFHAARVAEIARAVIERLNPDEQATVWALYCAGLHTQHQQAASLKIRVPALKVRKRNVFIKLLDWFTPGGHALRTLAADGHAEMARRARVVERVTEQPRLAAAKERQRAARSVRPGPRKALQK